MTMRQKGTIKAKVSESSTLQAIINTNARPKIGFTETRIIAHSGMGKVTIERREDELWIGGKKTVLYQSKFQQNGGYIDGYSLEKEIAGRSQPNLCVRNFLMEDLRFVPDFFNKSKTGEVINIYFFGTQCRGFGGDRRFIGGISRREGEWVSALRMLHIGFSSSDYVALLEEGI